MKKQSKEHKIKISPTKGRPMLNWVGKKPLDYVKGYPAVLMEIFINYMGTVPGERGVRSHTG